MTTSVIFKIFILTRSLKQRYYPFKPYWFKKGLDVDAHFQFKLAPFSDASLTFFHQRRVKYWQVILVREKSWVVRASADVRLEGLRACLSISGFDFVYVCLPSCTSTRALWSMVYGLCFYWKKKPIFRCGYRISLRGYVRPLVRWSVGRLVMLL